MGLQPTEEVNVSDTPRTDAEALKWGPHEGVMNVVLPAHFARALERENAKLREGALKAIRCMDSYGCGYYDQDEFVAGIALLRAALGDTK